MERALDGRLHAGSASGGGRARAAQSHAAPAIASRLAAVRDVTLAWLDAQDPASLRRAMPPLGPPLWDLFHVAHFEQEWALLRLGAPPVLRRGDAALFDPRRNPRAGRRGDALDGVEAARERLGAVRAAVLAVLASGEARADDPLLLERGWVWRMVARHEEQHQEILLQWSQLCGAPCGRAVDGPPALDAPGDDRVRVAFDGGEVEIGDGTGDGYDNERPRHAVTIAPFAIARAPVTNASYLAFVESGGYGARKSWSPAGRAWLARSGARHPRAWVRAQDGGFRVRRFGRTTALPLDEPVQHVSAHEADAFARWAGARLPSEAEWEHAAASGRLVLAHGAVWQWTSSRFRAYPGFRAWPYDDYSAPFFGERYRVLRGGAWTVGDDLARDPYRNWDLAVRDQLFAGLRLAWDGGDA